MTPTQRLAGMLLGEPVDDWIARQRAEGKGWRTIAADLRERTNGQVDVSHEAVRRWTVDLNPHDDTRLKEAG